MFKVLKNEFNYTSVFLLSFPHINLTNKGNKTCLSQYFLPNVPNVAYKITNIIPVTFSPENIIIYNSSHI